MCEICDASTPGNFKYNELSRHRDFFQFWPATLCEVHTRQLQATAMQWDSVGDMCRAKARGQAAVERGDGVTAASNAMLSLCAQRELLASLNEWLADAMLAERAKE